jgi:phage baseplate assembly protein W
MADPVSGTAFPFRIDAATGGVARASGTDKLRQNVRVILSTRFGERPMLRDFGTRIHSLVHDPNDAVLSELLQTQAQQALLQFEPRVLVTQTQVVQGDEGEVNLLLNYTQTTAPVADQLILPLF